MDIQRDVTISSDRSETALYILPSRWSSVLWSDVRFLDLCLYAENVLDVVEKGWRATICQRAGEREEDPERISCL